MSDIRTLKPSRRTMARLGVAGAAALASTFTLVPAALADETPQDVAEPTAKTPLQTLLGIGTGGEDGSGGNETGTDGTGDPSTAPTTPAPTEPAPAEQQKVEVAADDVEPNFGLQKVRVGVKIADGSVVPPGTTTLGTTIRITETGPNVPAEGRITECTTTLESIDDPTATFCEFDNQDVFDDDIYISAFGSAVKIKQLTVNENLIIDSSEPSVGPCTPPGEEDPFCDETTLLLVDRVQSGSDDDGGSDHESDDEEEDDEAELPDAGGADRRLLGYGLALTYGGGVLLLSARLARGKYVRFD
jgi:hypothetical protein